MSRQGSYKVLTMGTNLAQTGSPTPKETPLVLNLKKDSDVVQIPDLVLTDRLAALMNGIINSNRLFNKAETPEPGSRGSGKGLRDSAHKLKQRTKVHFHQKLLDKLEQVAEFAKLAHQFLLMLSDPRRLENDVEVVNQRCMELGTALYNLQKSKALGAGHRKKIGTEESFQEMLNFYVLSVHAKHREGTVKKKHVSDDSPDRGLTSSFPSARGVRGETIIELANQFVTDQMHQVAPARSPLASASTPVRSTVEEDKTESHSYSNDGVEKSYSSGSLGLNVVKKPLSPRFRDKPFAKMPLSISMADRGFRLPGQNKGRMTTDSPKLGTKTPPTTEVSSLRSD
jgi:hypothetical protein